jgi:sigma-B regulation protein RsbU (phosphoserine phosphatase)
VEFEWSFLPSLFVSGDELNFFRLDETHVGFYNLDVAGHGVPAAMMSVTLSKMLSPSGGLTLLKSVGTGPIQNTIQTPATVAKTLNEQFQVTATDSIYFTMFYGVLNVNTGVADVVQAGHTSPILLHSDGSLEVLSDGDPPVGLISDIPYHDQQVRFRPGDRLFVYSDGISECEDGAGLHFGETRLSSLLRDSRHLPLADSLRMLEHDLRAWRGQGNVGFLDDVSMLALQYR